MFTASSWWRWRWWLVSTVGYVTVGWWPATAGLSITDSQHCVHYLMVSGLSADHRLFSDLAVAIITDHWWLELFKHTLTTQLSLHAAPSAASRLFVVAGAWPGDGGRWGRRQQPRARRVFAFAGSRRRRLQNRSYHVWRRDQLLGFVVAAENGRHLGWRRVITPLHLVTTTTTATWKVRIALYGLETHHRATERHPPYGITVLPATRHWWTHPALRGGFMCNYCMQLAAILAGRD